MGGALCSLENSEEIKDKMKGQKAQRNEYKKCYMGRDQDECDEYERSRQFIRNLVQSEEIKT